MRPYTVVLPTSAAAVAAARDIICLETPATMVVVIFRAWIEQSGSVTSEQARGLIQRASTRNTTGATAATPRPLSPGDPASSCTVSCVTTSDNTLTGDPMYDDGFNWVSGYNVVLAPEERIWVPPSSKIVLRLDTAPSASKTVRAGFSFAEVG